jgi:hypothetical protein
MPDGKDCTLDGLKCWQGECVWCDAAESCDGKDNTCNGVVDESPADCVSPNLCHGGLCYKPSNVTSCKLYEYGGHVYQWCTNTAASWTQAEAACQAWNGTTLAVVNDKAENDFITGLAAWAPVWIGANDQAAEGQWTNPACCSSYTFFCDNQPDNWNEEDCVGANFQTWGEKKGCWNDYDCVDNVLVNYVCEGQ